MCNIGIGTNEKETTDKIIKSHQTDDAIVWISHKFYDLSRKEKIDILHNIYIWAEQELEKIGKITIS